MLSPSSVCDSGGPLAWDTAHSDTPGLVLGFHTPSNLYENLSGQTGICPPPLDFEEWAAAAAAATVASHNHQASGN